MLSLFDMASMKHALSTSLDPQLHDLLHTRVEHIIANGLTELTHVLVIQADDTEEQIKNELGMSPLTNPYDEARYGSRAFQPYWDWLEDHGGFFECIIAVGNSGFAYVLLIQDIEGVDPRLLSLCRSYAGCNAKGPA